MFIYNLIVFTGIIDKLIKHIKQDSHVDKGLSYTFMINHHRDIFKRANYSISCR